MFIAEVYRSVQGEGLLTGSDSIFVRTSGCNLRCGFCDTPFASWHPEGTHRSVDDLVRQCAELDCRHVVITGGEPMLAREISGLTSELALRGHHITIETAGTVFRPVHCDLMSISPKLANSNPGDRADADWQRRHEQLRHQPDVIRELVARHAFQIKFVVCEPADFQEIESWLREFPEIARDRVLLMPEGISASELESRETWLRPACAERGFRFCPRMHIHWFGNRRGT